MATPKKHKTGMTYEEVAKVLGVSHQRVQQIEAEALRKLRGIKDIERLRIFLEEGKTNIDQTIYIA
jgi:DNA-directed RNA polymerase sigma subunit (sigma70/sigma32)